MRHFTADPHFDDHKPLNFSVRPFSSLERMNDYLIDKYNTTIKPDDTLIIAGDVAACNYNKLIEFRKRLLCKDVWLVYGNHDIADYGDAFEKASEALTLEIEDNSLYVHHYPCVFWPRSHHGGLHVYGHCHAQREQYLDTIMPGRRSMDIGVDNAYMLLGDMRAFTEFEIYTILSARRGHHDLAVEREWESRQRELRAGILLA